MRFFREDSYFWANGALHKHLPLISVFSPFCGTNYVKGADHPYTYSPLIDPESLDPDEFHNSTQAETLLDTPMGLFLSPFKQPLEWVKFNTWRNQVIFAERPSDFQRRRLSDPATSRRIITRGEFVSRLRNEEGSHLDSSISEVIHGVRSGHHISHLIVKADGTTLETVSGTGDRAAAFHELDEGDTLHFIANKPSDAIARAIGGEVVLTLKRYLDSLQKA
jgi:hypothetical protein